MTKRKVFSIIGLIITAFLIVNLFLPLLKNGSYSVSTWEYFDKNDAMHVNIIILVDTVYKSKVLKSFQIGTEYLIDGMFSMYEMRYLPLQLNTLRII